MSETPPGRTPAAYQALRRQQERQARRSSGAPGPMADPRTHRQRPRPDRERAARKDQDQ